MEGVWAVAPQAMGLVCRYTSVLGLLMSMPACRRILLSETSSFRGSPFLSSSREPAACRFGIDIMVWKL